MATSKECNTRTQCADPGFLYRLYTRGSCSGRIGHQTGIDISGSVTYGLLHQKPDMPRTSFRWPRHSACQLHRSHAQKKSSFVWMNHYENLSARNDGVRDICPDTPFFIFLSCKPMLTHWWPRFGTSLDNLAEESGNLDVPSRFRSPMTWETGEMTSWKFRMPQRKKVYWPVAQVAFCQKFLLVR